MPITPEARDLLIRTIIGEAEGEGPEGWQAVANTAINRAFTGQWGEDGDLTRVIHAPSQFATWANGNPRGSAVTPNDPMYQRIGQVVDGVVSGQLPDNTGGATHYYASGGPGAAALPAWAQGHPGQQIGNHTFFKLLPIHNAAATQTVGDPASSGGGAEARNYLASLSGHPTRAGDTSNFHPEFATRLAAAIQQARAAGLNVGVGSGFREPNETTSQGRNDAASRFDAAGNSAHSYGLAADISGLDGANGPITQRWAQIAEANGLHNPYGIGNAAEANHWQLPEQPLNHIPGGVLDRLKTAKASGNMQSVWDAYPVTQTVYGSNQGPEMVGQTDPGAGQSHQGDFPQGPPSSYTTTPSADLPAQNAQPAEGPAAALPGGDPTKAATWAAAVPTRQLPMGQGDQSTQHERSNMNAYIQPGAVMAPSQGGTSMALNKGYGSQPVKQGSVVSPYKEVYTPQRGSLNKGFGTSTAGPTIPAAVSRTVQLPPRRAVPAAAPRRSPGAAPPQRGIGPSSATETPMTVPGQHQVTGPSSAIETPMTTPPVPVAQTSPRGWNPRIPTARPPAPAPVPLPEHQVTGPSSAIETPMTAPPVAQTSPRGWNPRIPTAPTPGPASVATSPTSVTPQTGPAPPPASVATSPTSVTPPTTAAGVIPRAVADAAAAAQQTVANPAYATGGAQATTNANTPPVFRGGGGPDLSQAANSVLSAGQRAWDATKGAVQAVPGAISSNTPSWVSNAPAAIEQGASNAATALEQGASNAVEAAKPVFNYVMSPFRSGPTLPEQVNAPTPPRPAPPAQPEQQSMFSPSWISDEAHKAWQAFTAPSEPGTAMYPVSQMASNAIDTGRNAVGAVSNAIANNTPDVVSRAPGAIAQGAQDLGAAGGSWLDYLLSPFKTPPGLQDQPVAPPANTALRNKTSASGQNFMKGLYG